ncbi:translation elongation factor 4 [Patescibacteria group bacterium]|nr:translation elongation factor 4 [Patescibacteria group bacterium]
MKNIRNFVIISHVDHGKSTLADRFLELTQAVGERKMRPQFLDMMDLERERGITIKLQPVQMIYKTASDTYCLNLIDTPGHVDFSYEVSRSLVAVEGAILLVDATKGIQAQTVCNLELAKAQGLVIIPAVNKIDLKVAQTEQACQEMANLLNIREEEIIRISAKNGTNVEKILEAVIEKIPPPKGDPEKPLRALIFDSKYDSYKGVIAFVRIKEGKIEKEEKISLMATKASSRVKEVGVFKPELTTLKELKAGEIGYIATGIKEPGKVRVGDTITNFESGVQPLEGYREPSPVVFASLYPQNPDDFDLLKDSLAKLKLTDPSFIFEPESKEALGRGFRCGFLGSLHTEIICERLSREFGLDLIISAPSVVYKIIDKDNNEDFIYSSSDWPDTSLIKETKEPWVRLEIISPSEYLGKVLKVLESIERKHVENKYFGQEKVLLVYEVPLREIIVDFYNKLKGATQGYASLSYEILGYRGGDLIKLDILIAGELKEAFSKIVPQKDIFEEGKKIVKKLKEVLPPQLFSVPLQAVVGGKIIARETLRAQGKDVTAPLYGGDYSRKRKLLEKQKKGKKLLKEKGKIKIPPKVFLEVFKSG